MKLFKPIMVLSILLLGSISNLPWVNPVTPLYSSLPGGAIWGTWTMANSPYYIEGNITVPFGKILSIEAGVDVVMNGSYHIFIGGQLFANGTLFSKINFKTNGTSDGMGSWKGLKFNSTGSGKLENCSIVNATHGILLNNTKDVIINNSYFYDNYYGMRIENNSYNNLFSICNFDANIYGMYFDNSPVNKILNGCTFRYGSYGLSFNNGSNNNIIGNCYSSFNNFGLYINSSSYNRIILDGTRKGSISKVSLKIIIYLTQK